VIAKHDRESEQVERAAATKKEAREIESLFEAILQGIDEAVMVRGTSVSPGDTIIYANESAAHLLGFASVAELLAVPPGELSTRYEFYDEAGQFIHYNRLPSRLAFEGKSTPPCLLRFRMLPTGEERWAILRTIPIEGLQQRRVEFVVSISLSGCGFVVAISTSLTPRADRSYCFSQPVASTA